MYMYFKQGKHTVQQTDTEGVEIDTRPKEQDEAVGDDPSTGAAPQHLRLPNPSWRPATTVVEEEKSQIRPANNQIPNRQLHIQAKERQQRHHLEDDDPPAPDSCEQSPNLTLGAGEGCHWDGGKAGTSYSPAASTPPPRRHRPDKAAAKGHPTGEP